MSLLEICGLKKAFGGKEVLDGLDLKLERGRSLALLGPSGTGKSTLLRLVAGLERPDAGSVFIGGRDVTRLPPEKRGVALIFQDYALFDNYDVAGNIAFSLKLRRRPAREIAETVEKLAALTWLTGMERRRPCTLSGGEKQRVALARALAANPTLILMDEPFSGLDTALRENVLFQTRQLLTRMGCTAVIVTHDWAEACAFGDGVALMDNGRILQSGVPEEVYSRPVSAAAAKLTGPANILPCVVSDGCARSALGVFPLCGENFNEEMFHVEHLGKFPSRGGGSRQKMFHVEHFGISSSGGSEFCAQLCVRPEKISVVPDGQGEAEVASVGFSGRDYLCVLRCGDRLVKALLPSGKGLSAGARASLRVSSRDLWLIPAKREDCE